MIKKPNNEYYEIKTASQNCIGALHIIQREVNVK